MSDRREVTERWSADHGLRPIISRRAFVSTKGSLERLAVCRVAVPGVRERLRLGAPVLMRVVESWMLGLSSTSREENVRKLLLDCVILLERPFH